MHFVGEMASRMFEMVLSISLCIIFPMKFGHRVKENLWYIHVHPPLSEPPAKAAGGIPVARFELDVGNHHRA